MSADATMTPAEMMRFFDKVSPAQPSACWNWIGSRDRWGYGLMRVDGKTRVIHKVVYEHFNGTVTPGLELDHTCKNASCVNPAHLEQVTHSVNITRGNYHRPRGERGRFKKAAENA